MRALAHDKLHHLSVARQWHPTRNGDWTAFDFTHGSNAVVWWKCKRGPDHEWQASICTRTGGLTGCPFCAGQKVSVTNSLPSKFPKIAREWHPTRNGKLRPTDVTWGSSKNKVWWKCRRYDDHVWQTTVVQRTSHGRRCPFCTHQKVSALNSLKVHFPYIAAQLHPSKNGNLKASEIACCSTKKLWWFCRKGGDHVWQATPASRTSQWTKCPFCSGLRASSTNSVASLYPSIAEEWDKRRNGKLKPSDVTVGSHRKVWWRCKYGHSWQQTVRNRINAAVPCCWKKGERRKGQTH